MLVAASAAQAQVHVLLDWGNGEGGTNWQGCGYTKFSGCLIVESRQLLLFEAQSFGNRLILWV